MKTAAVYLRVSTSDQDNANQETGILHFASLNGFQITDTVRDTRSSTANWRDRDIEAMLHNLPPGATLLVAEISRLARSTLEVLEIAALAAQCEITIIATKNNLTLNGSLESKITTTILGLAAEIEREFIRSRTKEALARAKASGRKLGRPVGTGGKSILDGRETDIAKYLRIGLPKSNIAKLLECSRGTLDTKLLKISAENANLLTRNLLTS